SMAERERAASRLLTLGVRREQFPDIAARKDVSTTVVVSAPRGGVVVERNVVPGQVVAYGQSDTPVSLFVIADLSTMRVLSAVHRENGTVYVLVATGESAYERRPIAVGADIDGAVEVERGLSPDDRVVGQGSILLKKTVK